MATDDQVKVAYQDLDKERARTKALQEQLEQALKAKSAFDESQALNPIPDKPLVFGERGQYKSAQLNFPSSKLIELCKKELAEHFVLHDWRLTKRPLVKSTDKDLKLAIHSAAKQLTGYSFRLESLTTNFKPCREKGFRDPDPKLNPAKNDVIVLGLSYPCKVGGNNEPFMVQVRVWRDNVLDS